MTAGTHTVHLVVEAPAAGSDFDDASLDAVFYPTETLTPAFTSATSDKED